MKQVIVLALVAGLAASCKKDGAPLPPKFPDSKAPEMIYTDLQNRELKFHQAQAVDLDQDNKADIGFSTWYIGDPIEKKDKILFFAGSYVHSQLLVGQSNNSPAFKLGDVIPAKNYPGLEWYPVSQVEMAYRITPETGPVYWEGQWKNASHQYLAVQVTRDGQRYNGWIEVSFDMEGEKLILHKAAICKVAGKAVVAGK